jgi:hypothetical protein
MKGERWDENGVDGDEHGGSRLSDEKDWGRSIGACAHAGDAGGLDPAAEVALRMDALGCRDGEGWEELSRGCACKNSRGLALYVKLVTQRFLIAA